MLFWTVIVVFTLSNGLLAWEVTFNDLPQHERPRIANEKWFDIATTIGGIGWLAVPVMFYSKYGFLGAGLGWLGFFIFGLVFILAMRGLTENAPDTDRTGGTQNRTALDEAQEVGGQLLVKGYRNLAQQQGVAPTGTTSDDEIIGIYKKVGTAFKAAATERGEHIPARQLNFIVWKFLQLKETIDSEMLASHLEYEVSKYNNEGLRSDYCQELKL